MAEPLRYTCHNQSSILSISHLAFHNTEVLHILFHPPRLPFHRAPPHPRISSFRIPIPSYLWGPHHSSFTPLLICSNFSCNSTLYYDLPINLPTQNSRMFIFISKVYRDCCKIVISSSRKSKTNFTYPIHDRTSAHSQLYFDHRLYLIKFSC